MVLEFVKYASIASTAIFGVLGATARTHDSDSRLNQKGRVTIVGVICSALLGTVAQAIESRVKRDQAETSRIKSQQLADQQTQSLRQLQDPEEAARWTQKSLDDTKAAQTELGARADKNIRISLDLQAAAASSAKDLRATLTTQQAVAKQLADVAGRQDETANSLQSIADAEDASMKRLDALGNAAQKQVSATETVLGDMRRSLNPFRDVKAAFTMLISQSTPEIQAYVARLERGLPPFLKQWERDSSGGTRTLWPVWTTTSNRIVRVGIAEGATLYPSPREHLARAAAESYVAIDIFRTPIDIGQYGKATNPGPDLQRPDVQLEFNPETNGERRSYLTWGVPNRVLMLQSYFIDTDARVWNGTGRILSTLDLAGAQAFISLLPLGISIGDSRRLEPEQSIPVALTSLDLAISDRQPWSLPIQRFVRHEQRDGSLIYEYRFPLDLEIHRADASRAR
jgi:hypothetical protein